MADVQSDKPISYAPLRSDDNRRSSEALGKQMNEGSHTAWDLAHDNVRDSLGAHDAQHNVEYESVAHQPVRGLSHILGVLHLHSYLVLPRFFVA